ncbi:MAG: hypothetical protein C5B48_07045 [Candidatus Rokuibacteriota bacterium]|nr:MAG: hypothetical protein C5B48_07045 [Candidatus Rokubacteria bacterium]
MTSLLWGLGRPDRATSARPALFLRPKSVSDARRRSRFARASTQLTGLGEFRTPLLSSPTVNRVLETDGYRIESDLNGHRTVVIPLEGELDIYTVPEVKGQLIAAVEQGAQRVVVDLSSASFVDSMMLSVLLSTVKRLRAVDGQLAVVCTNPSILKLLEITLLDRVFPVYDDCSEALRGDSLEPERSDR